MRASVLPLSGTFVPFVLVFLATFIPGSFASRFKVSTGMVHNRPDKEPLKPNVYGSKAWRATHGVSIGMECKGFTMHLESGIGPYSMEWHRHVETGGWTINSVYKESPKACGALCEQAEDCVAWSWNRVDESCYVQNSCERRIPNPDMVSGMKASFTGKWYCKKVVDGAGFDVEHPYAFRIDVDQKGEMILRMVDVRQGIDIRGNLEMASGSGHDLDAQQRGDELEVRLKLGTYKTTFGTMQLRLVAGKLKVCIWSAGGDIHEELIAEKKEEGFEPFQRVTVKVDQVISASDVHDSSGNTPASQARKKMHRVTLRRGDGGTVDQSSHPWRTSVIFDHDPDKVVWVNDDLLVKTTLLEEVSEEEVKDVLENLADDLISAIRDPITKQILRDPVKTADGYTYDRRNIGELIRRGFETHTPDFTIMSLVSSVIQKVNASRAAKPTLFDEVSEQEVKDVLKNLGDDLIKAISDPIRWHIFRDPVKAADGFTYERRSIQELIWQAQAELEIPKNQFGTPLSSVKLTPDHTIRSLVSSLIQKVNTVRAARGEIQKHWRGFQVRKDTSQLELKLEFVEPQMEDH